MKTLTIIRNFIVSSLVLLSITSFAAAAAVTRIAVGANAAAIQATVDLFRADLGGVNNGVGSSLTTGRREINWDGVPDAQSAPNILPFDFFNTTSPRGAVFESIGNIAGQHAFRVSTNAASGTAVRLR